MFIKQAVNIWSSEEKKSLSRITSCNVTLFWIQDLVEKFWKRQ